MYAKVFSQIFDSSIADDYELRHFFMDLLVLSDCDGIVDMTINAIASRTRIPVEKVALLIRKLELPDTQSRTPDAEGRRIKRLDNHREWGWVIINYDRFRAIGNDIERKQQVKARVSKFRSKIREINDVTVCNADVTLPPVSACVSVSVSGSQEGVSGEGLLDPVFIKDLLATYRRPAHSRLNHIEQSSLAQIIRDHPKYREEWDVIIAFRQKEPRYFPQSLSRLLSTWQETLDRANNHVPDPDQPKTILDKELDAIERMISKL